MIKNDKIEGEMISTQTIYKSYQHSLKKHLLPNNRGRYKLTNVLRFHCMLASAEG